MVHDRVDITDDARLLLQAIDETKGRFGFNLPIEVLQGRKNARVTKQGFDRLASHGKGAHRSDEHWKVVGQSLVQELLVDGRSAGAKGSGKGKGPKMTVYAVSGLGRRVLQGENTAPIFADLEADAAEAVRAKRPRRSSAPPEQTMLGALPNPGSLARPGSSPKPRKNTKASAGSRSPLGAGGAQPPSAENGLRPAPNPGEIACSSPLPRALDKALMPFQRAGVAFAVRRGGRVLIGDDMGLGKTIQAIATCCAFRADWPVLIVVPNSVRLVWADELERWIPDLGPFGVNVIKTASDLAGLTGGAASFHIATYGILSRASPVRDFIRENNPFKFVVVDESHMIKNRTSLRTRELLQIVKHATRVVLLSGTPALARPLELYTQIEAIEPGLFKSYTAFTSRYCNPKWTPFGMDLSGASNLNELHGYLRPLMVRRLKADVLSELPAKRRQRIQLEVDKAAAVTCASLKEELVGIAEDDPKERHSVLMQLYRETSVVKMGPVCEYVENLMQGGSKFLVFGHHLAMLDALEAVASKNSVKFIRIDGSVSASERLRRVNEFQADDTVQVAILSIMAAGVGITLTAASTVVFAELHWTPGVLVQAEDRAHRIGQQSSVNIHYLVASGTIDDMIWKSVYHKVEVVSKLCDGRQDHLVASVSGAAQALEAIGAAAREGAPDDVGDLLAVAEGTPPQPKAAEVKPPDSAKKTSAPKRPALNVLSMLQGKASLRRWTCQTCRSSNAPQSERCSACGDIRCDAAAPKASPGGLGTVIDVDDVIESASEAEVEEAVDEAKGNGDEHRRYSFCVSRVTGRTHVLDAESRPVGCNFKLVDWEASRDASAVFGEALQADASAMRVTEAFLRQWSALKVGEQRQLLDQAVFLPLSAYTKKKVKPSREAT